MATSGNNRDVKMTLAVETLGEEGIVQLGRNVRELAKQGGDAAPEFAKLADEIDRLGEQSKALNTFKDLADETETVVQVQERAAASAADLKTRLEELSAVTALARTNQAGIRTELELATAAYHVAGDELKRMRIETTNAEKQDTSYIEEKRKLALAQQEQAQTMRTLKDALKDANTEVRDAEKAEGALATAYARSEKAAAAAAAALTRQNAALGAAADAAKALGAETENVAAAQAQIVQSLNRVGDEADTLTLRVQRLRAEEEELANVHVFEQQFQEAQRLVETIRLTEQFDAALQRTTEGQREAAAAAREMDWQKEAFEIVEAAEAAQRLARETELLVAVENELAASRAFDKQAAGAKELVEAAGYVRFWRTELEKVELAAQEAADAAKTAAQQQVAASKAAADAAADAAARIDNAFGTVGVRSAESLRNEINGVRTAMETIRTTAGVTGAGLTSAFTAGNARIAALERELRGVNGQLTTADRLAGLFKNSIGQISAGNVIADGIGYLVNKVKELGRAFIESIVQIDQMRRGLTAVYQSSAVAAAQIVFLKNTANQAGVAFGDISSAFVKFSAATRAANIPLADTNALFAAVTRAAGTLGLSGESVTGMLEALGQMASKGTVSMEELRQQLGDRLPGALSLVAKGLGITEAQLIKLVEAGSLAARDLFPALTKALTSMQGSTDGLVPSYEKLKNVMTETAQNAGDAGWTSLLTAGLKFLTVAVGLLVLPLSALSEIFFGLVRSAGILVGALVTLTNPLEALKAVVTDAAERQGRLTDAFDSATGSADAAAAATAAHTQTLVEAGVAAANLTTATTTTTVAQAAAARMAKVAADANLGLSSQLVQNVAMLDEMISRQDKDTESKEKLAKAIKIEGDALVSLIALRGSEQQSLTASVEATERNVTALTTVADAHRTETELLVLKRDEITRVALAQDGTTKQRQQEIDAISKKIAVSAAETEQAKQAQVAAQADLAIRQLQVDAYKDNSAALGQYMQSLEAAKNSVEAMKDAQRAGMASQEDADRAVRALTAVTYLYNDAVNDTIKKLDQESRSRQAALSVAQAKLSVEQSSLMATAATLRAQGDLVGAIEFEISAKGRQIEALRLTMAARNAEAQAAIDAANVELKALDVADAMYESKKKEIEIRLENAKAKQIEAKASDAVIRGIQLEIDALRNLQNVRNPPNGGKPGPGGNGSQPTKGGRQPTQEVNEFGKTSDGFKANKDGSAAGTFTNNLPVDQAFALVEKMKRNQLGGVTEVSAQAAMDQANNALQDMQAFLRTSPGAASAEYITSTQNLFQQTKAAYDKVVAQNKSLGAQNGQGGSRMVTVNIGGRASNVNTASDADADALVGIMKQLETASGRSTK